MYTYVFQRSIKCASNSDFESPGGVGSQWNLLPGNIVDIEDRENFKNSVQEHLINLEE